MKREFDKFYSDVAANYKYLEIAEQERMPNPSLWAYYSTLPAWCRNHSIVRSILFAFEYHKPELTLRDKELAMNLACSYLRPIEGRLKEVIIQAAQSQKLRLDVTLGKQMMNELKFYAPDPATLGSDTEDEADDSGQQNQIAKLLAGGIDGEEEVDKSLMDKVMAGINATDTDKER